MYECVNESVCERMCVWVVSMCGSVYDSVCGRLYV